MTDIFSKLKCCWHILRGNGVVYNTDVTVSYGFPEYGVVEVWPQIEVGDGKHQYVFRYKATAKRVSAPFSEIFAPHVRIGGEG